MVQLTDFVDFFLDQGPTIMSGPEEFVVKTQLQKHGLMGFYTRGRGMSMMVDSQGSDMRDELLLSIPSSTKPYTPGKTSKAKAVTGGVYWKQGFHRYENGGLAWQEEEVTNNVANLSDEARVHKWKDILTKRRIFVFTDIRQYFENSLARRPHRALMEGPNISPAVDRLITPFNVYCNELPFGLPTAAMDEGGLAWTTIEEVPISAGVNEKFVPTQVTYSNLSPGAPGNLLDAIDEAMRLSNFESPATGESTIAPATSEETAEGENDLAELLVSNLGTKALKLMFEARQSFWSNPNDYLLRPHINGVPITFVPILDSALIYPNGAGGAASTESDPTNNKNGPRINGLRSRSTQLVWQSGWMNKTYEPIRHPENITGLVAWIKGACNTICRDRAVNFCVSPSQPITV